MIILPVLLEKGDVFLKDGTQYRVVSCNEDFVESRAIDKHRRTTGGRKITLGRKSKKRLVLIADGDWGDIKDFPNIFTNSSQ